MKCGDDTAPLTGARVGFSPGGSWQERHSAAVVARAAVTSLAVRRAATAGAAEGRAGDDGAVVCFRHGDAERSAWSVWRAELGGGAGALSLLCVGLHATSSNGPVVDSRARFLVTTSVATESATATQPSLVISGGAPIACPGVCVWQLPSGGAAAAEVTLLQRLPLLAAARPAAAAAAAAPDSGCASLASRSHGRAPECAAFDPSGTRIAVTHASGAVSVWSLAASGARVGEEWRPVGEFGEPVAATAAACLVAPRTGASAVLRGAVVGGASCLLLRSATCSWVEPRPCPRTAVAARGRWATTLATATRESALLWAQPRLSWAVERLVWLAWRARPTGGRFGGNRCGNLNVDGADAAAKAKAKPSPALRSEPSSSTSPVGLSVLPRAVVRRILGLAGGW